MIINGKEVFVGWLTWMEIEPFTQQIIDMELEEMVVYHYPDREIPRAYPEQKVRELQQHLADGNTYFWGAICDGKLLGYHWTYTSLFIDGKRWNSRSTAFVPEARGMGLGTMALQSDIKKALEVGCRDMAANYVPFNSAIERVLKKVGYEVSRIEMVCKLDQIHHYD